MTYEEVIRFLEKNIENHELMSKLSITDEARNSHDKSVEMYKMTIEALEKQIPKKPSADMGWQYCGNCGLDMLTDVDREGREYTFCPHCGQRICREETE